MGQACPQERLRLQVILLDFDAAAVEGSAGPRMRPGTQGIGAPAMPSCGAERAVVTPKQANRLTTAMRP